MSAILALLCAAVAAPVAAQTPVFGVPAIYDSGSDTPAVALVDINHDRRPDLIVATCDNGTVRIRLNDGAGNFGAFTDIPAGHSAFGLVVADFDHDQNLDIATVDASADVVTILYGDGTGAFPFSATFNVGAGPYTLIGGDFNGDNATDLAVANEISGDITVLLNTNDNSGSFIEAAGSPYATGTLPWTVQSADVNHDTFTDLVVTDANDNTVTILLGDGSGAFTAAPRIDIDVSHGVADLAIVDFNHDGNLDLVITSPPTDEILLFTGNGDGSFVEQTPLATGAFPIAVNASDVNGDGIADLVVADEFDGAVMVFAGNGSGFDAGIPFDSGGDPESVATGDVDGDGKVDIAAGHDTSADTGVLLNASCCYVTVTRAGTGAGTVQSVPSRLFCGALCVRGFAEASPVELDATPQPGSLFAGWSGACSGTGPCTLPAGSDAAVTATFDALTLDAGPLPGGTVGSFYLASVTVSNGTAPYTFVLESGTLPSGLTLNDDGSIVGVPDTGGVFGFTLAATDANGVTGSRAYSITIAAAATSTIAFSVDAVYTDVPQEIELSAGVSAATDVNTGTVTFTVRDAANAIVGSPATSATVTEGIAVAAYVLPAGVLPQPLTITAVYNANASFLTSSGSDALTIVAAPSATTAAAASVPYSASNQAVPLSASVTSGNGVVNAGTVTFTVRDSANAVVGVPVVSGAVAAGTATAAYTLPAGTMAQTLSITAAFSGSTSFTASLGNASLTVTCPAIDIAPAVLPPLRLGQPFTVTFSVPSFSDATLSLTGSAPGLSVNGATLSGTPTSLGRFTITVDASSPATGGCRGSRTVTLDVMRPTFFVTGAGAGSPVVRGFDDAGTLTHNFYADDPATAGGVRVALGDITGDGVPDIVTAAGPGAPAATVHVFDGASGVELRRFNAFAQAQPGGLYVATADVNSDNAPDIIVGSEGALPEVRIFDGRSGAMLADFLAYPAGVPGVRVAAGDIDGDGIPEIIVAPPPGSTPEVRVFSATGVLRAAFLAYAPGFTGGVFVAAGDIDGDGRADIVTGADAGGGPHVMAFSGADLHVLRSFYAYSPFFGGGVRVAAGDLDLDGHAEILTAAGPGGGPHVRVFDGLTGDETTGLYAFDPAFAGGVFVAAAPAQSRMSIDLPPSGATLPPVFLVGGWAAVGLAVNDSGVDTIHAWAVPIDGSSPIFLGATTVGVPRPDVAARFGGIYADSGFNLTAGPLPPGTYDLAVYVHSSRTNTFVDRRVVRIVVTP